MGWISDALAAPIVSRIATSLEGIHTELKRLADHAEGITPPPRVVPELPEEPEMALPSGDSHYASVEAVEARYLATAGRLPTPEEVERELAGEEIPPEVSAAEMDRRLRVPR